MDSYTNTISKFFWFDFFFFFLLLFFICTLAFQFLSVCVYTYSFFSPNVIWTLWIENKTKNKIKNIEIITSKHVKKYLDRYWFTYTLHSVFAVFFLVILYTNMYLKYKSSATTTCIVYEDNVITFFSFLFSQF